MEDCNRVARVPICANRSKQSLAVCASKRALLYACFETSESFDLKSTTA